MLVLQAPLDHSDVVMPRSGKYVYASIKSLFDSNLESMKGFIEPLQPWLNSSELNDLSIEMEYDEVFIEMGYNEQYLLTALSLNSPFWKPVIPVYYLYGIGVLLSGGVSFRMRKECAENP